MIRALSGLESLCVGFWASTAAFSVFGVAFCIGDVNLQFRLRHRYPTL